MPDPKHQRTDQDAGAAKPPRFFAWLRRLAAWGGVAIAVALCAPTWLTFAARRFWIAELATHLAPVYCLLLAPATLLCWWFARRWLTLLVAATLAINLCRVAAFYLPAAAQPADRPAAPRTVFRVMTQNVFKQNRRHAAVVELVEQWRPDVLLLIEVNQRWVDGMAPLAADYPHRAAKLSETRSGLMLCSRSPLEEVRFEKLSKIDRFVAIAKVRSPAGLVTVVGVHPTLPRRSINREWRDDELLAVARLVATLEGPVVLMGDLNTTPWSPVFGDVLRVGGLRNSMQGFGVQPTWSYKGRWPPLLPIDHVLHTPDLATVDRRTGPRVGSDHRAVVADLVLADGERNARID